jgi:hypothetical protein
VEAASSPISGTLTVNWQAADADGNALRYDVLFSQDGGANFQPLVLDTSASSAKYDSNLLGGGPTIFRVTANDGILTGSGDSDPVQIADKLPQPMILNPGDGASFEWGQLVSLSGQANDAQDGSVAPASLAWSNQKGPLGSGAILDLSDLPVGENVITLTATNSKGLSPAHSITITITDDGSCPPRPGAGSSPSDGTWRRAKRPGRLNWPSATAARGSSPGPPAPRLAGDRAPSAAQPP